MPEAAVLPERKRRRAAGASPSTNGKTVRQRVIEEEEQRGATRKMALDGLTAIEYPAAKPAATIVQRLRVSSARRQKYAETRRPTMLGKSDIAVSPTMWGIVSSVYFWW